jgi:hypothetical protein
MNREANLTAKLETLKAEHSAVSQESAIAFVDSDTKAAASARQKLASLDLEISELTNALPLARQRDAADREQAARQRGINAASGALPIAERKHAVAAKLDKDVAAVVAGLTELHALGVQVSGAVHVVADTLGGVNKAAFSPALPSELWIKQFELAAGCFTDSPFGARGEDRAAELRGRALPWTDLASWAEHSVTELEAALDRHTAQTVEIPKVTVK